jgi:hypothetical protein
MQKQKQKLEKKLELQRVGYASASMVCEWGSE